MAPEVPDKRLEKKKIEITPGKEITVLCNEIQNESLIICFIAKPAHYVAQDENYSLWNTMWSKYKKKIINVKNILVQQSLIGKSSHHKKSGQSIKLNLWKKQKTNSGLWSWLAKLPNYKLGLQED